MASCVQTAYQGRLIPADDYFNTLQPMCAVAPSPGGSYQQASHPQTFCAQQVAISGLPGEQSAAASMLNMQHLSSRRGVPGPGAAWSPASRVDQMQHVVQSVCVGQSSVHMG